MPRVFISFAGADEPTALRVFDELSSRGAHVFQFLESSSPGSIAWRQVLKFIDEADFFVVLVSRASTDSDAVQAEIDHAFHRRINHRGRPVIIPLLLGKVEVPSELSTFSSITFTDVESGLRKLGLALGLANDDAAPSPATDPASADSIKTNLKRAFNRPLLRIVTPLAILSLAVTVFIQQWVPTTDDKPRSGPEVSQDDAQEIRAAVASTLGKLERWQKLTLSFYDQIQPTIISTTTLFEKNKNREEARDHFWQQATSVRAELIADRLDEDIESQYSRLYSYHPSIRSTFTELFDRISKSDEQRFSEFLDTAQGFILNASPDAPTAFLGDDLRSTVSYYRYKHSKELGAAIVEAEEILQTTINQPLRDE